jgi:3-oxoacyl-[acyl-carrier protein] reductase
MPAGPAPSPLAGRVALVTGGSGGIGRAVVRRLLAEGARVAAHYSGSRVPAEELVDAAGEQGHPAVAVQADLSDAAAPARLIDDVERALGPVEVLVANQGRSVRRSSYEDVDGDGWDATMAVNLRASFLLTRRVLPAMQRAGFGRILFTSSVAAFTGGVVGPDYAASKAGLHGLLHYLAPRLASDGITVNVIAPALIEQTGMLPGDPGDLAQRIPVGRLGRPDEVADLALAVLRNGYITDQSFSVDGGMHPS